MEIMAHLRLKQSLKKKLKKSKRNSLKHFFKQRVHQVLPQVAIQQVVPHLRIMMITKEEFSLTSTLLLLKVDLEKNIYCIL